MSGVASEGVDVDGRPAFRAPSGKPKDLFMAPGDYLAPRDRGIPEIRRSLELQRQGEPIHASEVRRREGGEERQGEPTHARWLEEIYRRRA